VVTQTTDKSYYAERVIRTIKRYIYRFITQNNTHRYIDALPDIVNTYNSAIHSSTGVAPKSINVENSKTLWWKIYKPKKGNKKKPYTLKIGDHVRIAYSRHKFSRGFDQTWTEEVFKVVGRFRQQNINQYNLQDVKGEEIKGNFYEGELQKVALPEIFPVEKVLRTKTVRGKKKYLVKYLGYNTPEWTDEVQTL
jgi:hypothetical protein